MYIPLLLLAGQIVREIVVHRSCSSNVRNRSNWT